MSEDAKATGMDIAPAPCSLVPQTPNNKDRRGGYFQKSTSQGNKIPFFIAFSGYKNFCIFSVGCGGGSLSFAEPQSRHKGARRGSCVHKQSVAA